MNHTIKRSLTKLVALVLCLGVAQNAVCAGKKNRSEGSTISSLVSMKNVELASIVAGLPVAVLANNAEKALAPRTAHALKVIDDLFVMIGQGSAMYNDNKAGVALRDQHYKALEILFRGADIAKHVKALAKKDASVASVEDDVEVTAMRKKLIASATLLRNFVAPVVQAAARGYVAVTENTEETRRTRLMVEGLAFLTNRLSDYVASKKGSLEADAQAVATMAGVVMLIVDYKRELAPKAGAKAEASKSASKVGKAAAKKSATFGLNGRYPNRDRKPAVR